MNLIGAPSEWLNLIDTLVPDILELVMVTWDAMPPLVQNAREDPTTETLCRLLRQNRNSGSLPFQIHIQMVELIPLRAKIREGWILHFLRWCRGKMFISL